MSARPQLEYEFNHNGERLLRMLQKHHPEYHPIVSIARIAHAAEDAEELETALKAHATVLRYVEPELKAIEISLADKNRRTIEVSLFEEVVDKRRDQDEIDRQERIGHVLDAELMPVEAGE